MRRFGLALALVLVGMLWVSAAQQPAGSASQSIYGFRNGDATQQREWENKFRAIPSPENMRSALQRLSAKPHAVGQPYDKDNAEWLLAQYKAWGLDAHIENFEVLMPTPKERVLELVEPTRFVAKLQEPAVAGDPTSNQQAEQLPTYNAYSIDGDVTAPLVFVNYGVPADYDELDRLGVSVKGAIVIAKYGASWRGIKPKVAAEHGAVGCIIYSDPRDDGYFMGDVFPQGAWRPKDGVQRGSVMDMPIYPGDPLTPDVGAVAGAKRLDIKDVKTITKIPVMPISYGDAQPLLAALGGRMAPMAWRGALGQTYHIGPGPAKVHLKVTSNWQPLKTLYDVIVTIPGSTYPNEWIVRGNHHDAWVNGAQDPLSGQVAEMEELRGYAELLKQGWKPKRTIIYAAWDGEEPGLLGSTEWAEAHADELRQKAVVYLNSDGNSRGYWGASGSHTLERFLNSVAKEVTDPEKNISVWQRAKLFRISRAANQTERDEIRSRPDLRIQALGSGSDYTVFLDHLGIASANLGYGGEAGGGIYHSIYDDFYWYTHFDDPDFVYGRALAQTTGTAVLRLADTDLLPFDFMDQADTVRRYVKELQDLVKSQQDEVKESEKEAQEGLFNAVSDPKHPLLPPKQHPMPPFLNFAPLNNGAEALSRAAERYQRAASAAQQSGAERDFAATNKLLMESERRLTLQQGLPNRPWFRHQLYAPGFYTGYGVKTIPAVREAIEQREYAEAEAAITRVGQVLQDEAAIVNQAAESLERAK